MDSNKVKNDKINETIKENTGFDMEESQEKKKNLQNIALGLFFTAGSLILSPVIFDVFLSVTMSAPVSLMFFLVGSLCGLAGGKCTIDVVNENFEQQRATANSGIVIANDQRKNQETLIDETKKQTENSQAVNNLANGFLTNLLLSRQDNQEDIGRDV